MRQPPRRRHFGEIGLRSAQSSQEPFTSFELSAWLWLIGPRGNVMADSRQEQRYGLGKPVRPPASLAVGGEPKGYPFSF